MDERTVVLRVPTRTPRKYVLDMALALIAGALAVAVVITASNGLTERRGGAAPSSQPNAGTTTAPSDAPALQNAPPNGNGKGKKK